MKKAQKLICLLLAMLTVLSLAACNNNTGITQESGPADTSVTGEEVPPVPTEKYDGYTFTVLMTCRNPDTVIVRDFEMNEGNSTLNVLNEALYKRNQQMQDEFDIVINPIVKYSSTNNGSDLVRNANIADDIVYDMCVLGTYSAAALAQTGDLCDLSDYGDINLSKSWWDQNINRDLKVQGKIYFTTGDISLVATQAMYGLIFNKEMFDAKGWDYPYQLVNDGEWTFDKMSELTLRVSDDLNADQKMDQLDQYGLGYINSTCIAFLGAAGEKIAKVNDEGAIELTITRERAANAVISFIELTQKRSNCINAQTDTDGTTKTAIGMFADGQLLFRAVEHLGFSHLRDTKLEYGILPLPKYDDTQDRYYTPVGSWDGSYVCIPAKNYEVDRTSKIIERTAYISQQTVTPAYYKKTLEGKYVRDEDSYDMITLEIQNRTYDIGYMYDFGGLQTAITTLSKNYSTNFASMLKTYQTKAETAISITNISYSGLADAE